MGVTVASPQSGVVRRRKKDASDKGKEKEEVEDADEADDVDAEGSTPADGDVDMEN